ncbi:dodecenoyl-CoA isomerase [Chytriomyces hyalinus]|nr:dodecenoyl-CoA isomerase [Chytriomyces hyalinus]
MAAVTTSRIGSILKLSLSSGPVNALSPPLITALANEIAAANTPKSGVTGILLASAAPKVFSAGLDLTQLSISPSNKNNRETVSKYIGSFQNLVHALAGSHVPAAAVVHGACPAGGTVLAFCTDYKVASSIQRSYFCMGLNETRVGLAPPLWLHALARNNLNSARIADRLVQLGYLCSSPQESLRHGYLDAVIADATPEALEAHAIEQLNQLAAIPWNARVQAKLGARKEMLSLLENGNTDEMVDCILGDEFQSVTAQLMASLKKK